MSIPEIDFSHTIEDADAQLQQELQGMFAIDTQSYLQRYSQIAEHLQADLWRADIQELYRCIHTIKGGAVTVGAEAALHVASVLEDVLSDLRYLEPAPPLTDRHLSHLLLECGELLSVALKLQHRPDIEPILNRIHKLHQEIRAHYLPQWNQVKQLQQEFVEQGFDLIVLELEIALEKLPDQGRVSDSTLQIAQNALEQLREIGQELQFAPTWFTLLNQAQELFVHPANAIWRSEWLHLFQALKAATQGEDAIAFEFANEFTDKFTDEFTDEFTNEFTNLASPEPNAALFEQLQEHPETDAGAFLGALPEAKENALPEIADWLDALTPLDILKPLEDFTQIDFAQADFTQADFPKAGFTQADFTQADFPKADFLEFKPASFHLSPADLAPADLVPADLASPDLSLPDLSLPDLSLPVLANPLSLIEPASSQTVSETVSESVSKSVNEKASESPGLQIPVALVKLDQSAQSLVETLLALQTTEGFYQTLQSQITQLVVLAQEGAQYITHLRQIQDDYALLDQQRDPAQSAQSPTPERYRQGYSIINRLLETSLRLSEVGAETSKTSQQMAESFRHIDRNAAKLQTTIEASRLVPFQNLSFRAKTILRELTTRYGKPAQLLVQGEQTELDVSIARELEPALLHMIRNAYDHGLESAPDRIAQGKPTQGTLTLSLQRQGNSFQFQIRDDGCGIDAAAVQARAEALGLPLTQTQTTAALLAVICQPGFSSQAQVNEISGRGIGMDVVTAQVARLNGRLELQTTLGIGTTFQLKFPVPRLLVPCILLQAGDQVFAIPNDNIKTIALFNRLQPIQSADQAGWRVDDEAGSTPVLDALHYWQPRGQSQGKPRTIADTAVCVYIPIAASPIAIPQNSSIPTAEEPEGLWLLADELLEQAELIINPLPAPLIAPSGFLGVSLQKNGRLVPILEAQSLIERLLARPSAGPDSTDARSTAPHPSETEVASSILIVDDAALMRRRLEASLNAYGYLTQTCIDGQDAWDWLQTHPQPQLIITDIEMPNMDGFTLIDRCRSQGITAPILVVSSRLSEEWSDEAHRLGAADYLTKGFSTIELIKKVNALLNL